MANCWARCNATRSPPNALVGNLALVANYGKPAPNRRRRQPAAAPGLGTGKFWFADWQAGGGKLAAHPERAFGPILFSQYTLSRGVLKMTAQMPPLGADDDATVRLEVQQAGNWTQVAEAPIHPEARTATFRVDDWDADRDVPYRLLYTLKSTDGTSTVDQWTGTVRRDPADVDVLTVADVSCNGHMAFPNAEYVRQHGPGSIPICWPSRATSSTNRAAATACSAARSRWPFSTCCANGICTAGPGAS